MSHSSPISATELLTRREAADFLGCSEKTIRNYIASGALAAYRVRGGRFLRIKRSDLEALLVRVPAGQIGAE